jgi:hypothetical protein
VASESPRPLRRRTSAAAAVAAVVAATAVAVAVLRDGGVREGGPLACTECPLALSSMGMDLGKVGTYGIDILQNRGDETAVLDGVTFQERSRGLQILGPLALRIGDYRGPGGAAAGLIRQFPPPHVGRDARPVAGFPVHPFHRREEAVELLIGFRPRRTGTLRYRSIRVHYHVGGTRYVATFTTALRICAPLSRYLRLKSCRD